VAKEKAPAKREKAEAAQGTVGWLKPDTLENATGLFWFREWPISASTIWGAGLFRSTVA